ncbi:alpha/beta-hydrolase [Panus rudis PR-1116 ss-1]|nr:alpha/beta-hydrolase [Panus rudis PR-1116 ss-1]
MHSGAYGGAFISKDTNKPFIGVAFKGSDRMRDWVTDADWSPMKAEEGIAFGSNVHTGFYKGLFGKFGSGGNTQVPFDVLVGNLLAAYKDRKNSILHFAGHSLGGAYCTLAYAEFLRRPNLVQSFKLGDMYSIAAPRTCEEPFATQVSKLTNGAGGSTKYTFRIVNGKDPVPTIPPRKASQFPKYPFAHPDGAWKIWKDKAPEKMPNEKPPGKPVDPLPITGIIWNAPDHCKRTSLPLKSSTEC